MEDFKKIVKMNTGGAVNAYCGGSSVSKKKAYKTGGSVEHEDDDIAQDKKIIKKAFKMHDEQEHAGEKTDLSKLKKGGRAKKAVGSVRKYECGGAVENAYGAKKSDKDIKDIANAKRQKPAKLCMGGKA